MAKYVGDSESPVTFGPGPAVCGASQATAWDNITKACFTIWGLGITIGDTTAPVQGGFEVFNRNMRCSGTQCPCVNPYQLPGVFV